MKTTNTVKLQTEKKTNFPCMHLWKVMLLLLSVLDLINTLFQINNMQL